MLKTQGERLDAAFLAEWARRLGLFDLHTEARAEAPPWIDARIANPVEPG